MATKIVIYFLLCLYTLQDIESKAVKGYGSSIPDLTDVSIDPEIRATITEIQMRLNQLQSTANYVIGSSVGLASKDVGLIASAAKENIKLIISLVNDNPNAVEQCRVASKLALDQTSTDAKTRLSACTKSSQFHLKVLGQEQRTIALRVAALNNELYLSIHRCKLEHPLPTDSPLVNECMRVQCNTLNQTIADYEEEMLNSVAPFTVAITQIVSGAQNCSQQVLILLEQQADQIRTQIDDCSNANNASNNLL